MAVAPAQYPQLGFLTANRDVFEIPVGPDVRRYPDLARPSLMETLGAGVIVDNEVWNLATALNRHYEAGSFPYDPEFQLTEEMLAGTPFMDSPELVSEVGSLDEFEHLRRWYMREWDARERLHMAGGWGMASSMLAGAMSPVSFISFGAGRMALTGARGAARGASAGLVASGAAEAALQAAQGFRTMAESGFAIGASTLFGAALGSAGAAVSRRNFRRQGGVANLILEPRVQSVIEETDHWLVSNQATRVALERARDRVAWSEGRALSSEEVLEIFRLHADRVESRDAAVGMLAEDGRLIFSAEAMEMSDAVSRGFDPKAPPEEMQVRAFEGRQDARAWDDLAADVEARPIREPAGELTDVQVELLRRIRERGDLDRAEVVEADFRTRAGAAEELEDLMRMPLAEVEPVHRARAIYLRRLLTMDEETADQVGDLAEAYGMSREAWRPPLRPDIEVAVHRLAAREADGQIESRLTEMEINRLELDFEAAEIPDMRPVTDIEGIGDALAARLVAQGISTAGDLRAALDAGAKVSGIGATRARRILQGRKPRRAPERPPRGLPPEADPLSMAVAKAYGVENLGLIVSNPAGRILVRSPSQMSKRVLANLAILDYKLARNYLGQITDEPVQLGILNWQLRIQYALAKSDQQYRKYLLGMAVDSQERITRRQVLARRIGSAATDLRTARLSRADFYAAVTQALRRGGRAQGVPADAVPHVEAAARRVREEVWAPVYKELEHLGKQGGVDPLSYVFRVYNVRKIRADTAAFERDMVQDLLEQGIPADEAEELVGKWTEGILATPYGRAPPNMAEVQIAPLRGAGRVGRQRVVEVREDVLVPWLRNDIREVLNAYLRTRLTDLELTKKFGSVGMRRQIDAVRHEYERLIAQAPDVAPPRVRGQPRTWGKGELAQQMEADIRDLEGVRDIMRGVYQLPADPTSVKGYLQRGAAVTRFLNFARIGGGFGIVALGDVGGMSIVNGARRTMGEFVNQMRGAIHPTLLKMAEADLEALHIDYNDVMNMRVASLWDVGEWGGIYTIGEDVMRRASGQMAFLSLLSPWTNVAKHIAARSTIRRLIDVSRAARDGRATPDQLASMRRAHLTDQDLVDVLDLYETHGGDEGGVLYLGLEGWRGPRGMELRRKVRNAILVDGDRAVVTPGPAEVPLIMHKDVGKVLFQFRRFGVSYTQKLFVPGMQGMRAGDLSILNALGVGIAMGAMVYMAKQVATKRRMPTDVGRIIQEGVVRADIWGALGEMDMGVAALTGGYSIRGLLGPDTFYGMQNREGYFGRLASWGLGPTYSTAVEGLGSMAGIANVVSRGNWSGLSMRQVQAMRRIWPYQNLFYLDWLFDAFENGVEAAARRDSRRRISSRTMGGRP